MRIVLTVASRGRFHMASQMLKRSTSGKSFLFVAAVLAGTARAGTLPSVVSGMSVLNGKIESYKFAGEKTTVVAFLSARCPCSSSHEPLLQQISDEFPDVAFVGIHSNSNESSEETAKHFANSALKIPVIQDSGAALATAFGALKTPHVFVVNK